MPCLFPPSFLASKLSPPSHLISALSPAVTIWRSKGKLQIGRAELAEMLSQNKLAVVCRYGGNSVEGPDHKVSYKDGTNRLIYIHPEIDYPALLSKLLQVCKFTDIESIKYQYPTLGLDSLVSVENDEDVLYMKDAFSSQRNGPIQLFIAGSKKTVPIHDAIPRAPPKPRIDKGQQIMKEKESHPRRERSQRGIVISEPREDDIRRPEPETSRGPEAEAIRRFGSERGLRDSRAGTSRNEGSPEHLSAPSNPFQFAMAQVILTPLLDLIFRSLASVAMEDVQLVWGAGADKELQILKGTLSAIQAVLEDAEERQLESEVVQDWLQKLQDIAYDTDNLVDEIVTTAQQLKMESGTAAGKKRKRHDVSSCLSSRWQDMVCRINEINVRLAKAAAEGRDLHLETRDGSRQLEIIQERRQLFSSVRDESPQVFGRESDREQIIKSLLSVDSGTREFSVVAIVGMSGVGKTTLAKVVYNDKRVIENFELRKWFCVSGSFDMDSLEYKLRNKLIRKKFLLVLDIVLNEMDSHRWEQLQVSFKARPKGSKILVTTRSQAVSDVMQATCTYNLKCLSKKDCWSLFVSEAFHDDNVTAYPDLLKIGVELVEKCKGLPLAAKALGGLLSSKREVKEWENISKSPMWDLQGPASEILPALRLSYQHLPAFLKPCFIFCSKFPKDYEFKKERLVQMWVAHGFIRPEEGKHIEDTGAEYFNDLLSRSFFQRHHEEEEEEEEWSKDTNFHLLEDPFYWDYPPSSVDMIFRKKTSYKMNGPFHDLAKFILDNECFRMEPINVESFYELKGLRTFFPLKIIDEKVADEMFQRLRFIRVLDLSHVNITELPNSIGNLRHLRYLNLSGTDILELPESICSIYNMQTLLLTGCCYLVELPNEMRKLTNLRHLDLEDCIDIVSMPPQIGQLNCLKTLPLFVVGSAKETGIAELKELTDIRGKLVIKQLDNVTDAEHARQANLMNKPLIDALALEWSGDCDNPFQSLVRSVTVADGLKPHPNLKVLEFGGYMGAHFPSWMMEMDLLLPNLEALYLSNCRRCSILPPLGRLPSLSLLVIRGMDKVKKIESISGGSPSLKDLFLLEMRNLEQWRETEGAFPFLGRLCIECCPQLRQLPKSPLANLTCLYIWRCDRLVSLPRLPPLKQLKLDDLGNLEEWCDVEEGGFPCLRRVCIENCPQLRQLTYSLLANLKCLDICHCERLVSLPRLPSLKQLKLDDLGNLEEWCGVGDAHFPHLQKLSISKCPNMRRWPTNLPLLTDLRVPDCCGFDALPLLPYLCKLDLGGFGGDRLLTSVPCLTSLSSLDISDILDLTSMPRGMLPALTQLKSLGILACSALEMLVEEDEHLPSTLTNLSFSHCYSLLSLPRGPHALTSLHTLVIDCCPRLTSLPEEGLPASLQKLDISRCPALFQRCRKDGGEDWPKISHVPQCF